MKKATLPITAAATAALMQLGGAAAHHPDISAVAGCIRNGQASVFVTATAWDTADPAHRVNNAVSVDWWNGSSWQPQAVGQFTATFPTFTKALIIPAPTKPATIRLRAIATVQWGPNADLGSQGESRETTVTVTDDCPVPPTTTVTTVVTTRPQVPSFTIPPAFPPQTAPDPKLPPFVIEVPPAAPAQPVVTTPRYTG